MSDINQICELVKIRFWGNPYAQTFKTNGLRIQHQDKVVAQSDRGLAVGIVNSFCFSKLIDPDKYLPILRHATTKDIETFELGKKEGVRLKNEARAFASELNLEMNIGHVCPVDSNRKFIIYFTAENKVDFRGLLKLLREASWQVELRHISENHQIQALGDLSVYGHSPFTY
jgi:cell fate regulator YaaT (PSP1 superfamily)